MPENFSDGQHQPDAQNIRKIDFETIIDYDTLIDFDKLIDFKYSSDGKSIIFLMGSESLGIFKLFINNVDSSKAVNIIDLNSELIKYINAKNQQNQNPSFDIYWFSVSRDSSKIVFNSRVCYSATDINEHTGNEQIQPVNHENVYKNEIYTIDIDGTNI